MRRLLIRTLQLTGLLALVLILTALLPGNTWAQQLVRATITNTTLAVTQSGSWTNVGVTGTFWPTTAGSPLSARITDGTNFLGTTANPVIVDEPSGSTVATSINGINGGSAASFGSGASGTTTLRVIPATDSPGFGVEDSAETASGLMMRLGGVRRDAAASSADTSGDNATLNTDANGLLWARLADPCASGATKTYFPVNISTATTTQIAAASASNYYYICAMHLMSAGTTNVVLVEDDTSACASPTAGLNGGTTAGTGYNLTAQTGIALGDGAASIMRTAATNRYICFITSAAVQVSGHVVAVAAP
jgi:hypothetical protein